MVVAGSLKESANAIVTGINIFGPKNRDRSGSANKKAKSVPRGTALKAFTLTRR